MAILVGQLSQLAGEKAALAEYIRSPMQNSAEGFVYTYNNRVMRLNRMLNDIQDTIKLLDPSWEGNNPVANYNLSRVVSQKELFLTGYGRINDAAFNRLDLDKLAHAFSSESNILLRTSIELSETLKEK